MEKADILEMSVHYLKEMRKLEKTQNGKQNNIYFS